MLTFAAIDEPWTLPSGSHEQPYAIRSRILIGDEALVLIPTKLFRTMLSPPGHGVLNLHFIIL